MQKEEQILSILTQTVEPMKKDQLIKASGLPANEVEEAINKLQKDDRIESPKAGYYRPKPVEK